MRTTSEIRAAWGTTPCRPQLANFTYWTGVSIPFEQRAIESLRALDSTFKAWNYRPKSGQTFGYACRRISGTSSWSLHSYGIATDVNSLSNPYTSRLITDMPRDMVEAALAIRTIGGHEVWGWGGNYSGSKDCLTGDTLVETIDGPRSIRDLVGLEVELLSTSCDPTTGIIKSEWVKAPVSSFGWQETYEVSLHRRGAKVVVRTSPHHRWAVKNRNGVVRFVESRDLLTSIRPGDGIPALPYPDLKPIDLDSTLVSQGIVWGDGSVYNRHGTRTPQAKIELCGEKAELRSWIESFARYWSESDYGPVAWGLPVWLKGLPESVASLSQLAGFFAGWFAVDGCVPNNQSPSISTSDETALSWLKSVAPKLGLTITSVTVQPAGKSGFGSKKTNYMVVFRSIPSWMLLRSKHKKNRRKDDRAWFNWRVESVRPTGLIEETFCPTIEGRNVVGLSTPTVPLLTGQSMHYEIVASPGELATGINWATVRRPGTTIPDPSNGGPVRIGNLVSVKPNPVGDGYWGVASDGGVFAWKGAPFFGSMGGKPLNAPMVDLVSTEDGAGYWLIGADGGLFNFGNAPYVTPYAQLATEWRAGQRAVVGGYYEAGRIWLVADTGDHYVLP